MLVHALGSYFASPHAKAMAPCEFLVLAALSAIWGVPRTPLGAGERLIVRDTQHNVASVTKHLPGACGGHDARKATPRLRASGMSRFEQFVTRDVPPRRATSQPYTGKWRALLACGARGASRAGEEPAQEAAAGGLSARMNVCTAGWARGPGGTGGCGQPTCTPARGVSECCTRLWGSL